MCSTPAETYKRVAPAFAARDRRSSRASRCARFPPHSTVGSSIRSPSTNTVGSRRIPSVWIAGDPDAPIHTDGSLREPTLFADGERIELPAEE